MIRLATAAVCLCACRSPVGVEPVATPKAGISIALYQDDGKAYSVVDDRRWVDVTGGTLVLDAIDPGAALPSLVIEPLGGSSLVVGQCSRERTMLPEDTLSALDRYAKWQAQKDIARRTGQPIDGVPEERSAVSSVQCAVTGAGRHLVRILYVSSTLRYSAQHDVTMTTSDRARVASRFAIATPAWKGARADVVLFTGVPGDERAPAAIARGSLTLDGSTAVLAAPPREVAARLRRVYDGALRTNARSDEADANWGRDSGYAVWVWLELEQLELPPGPISAHVEVPGEAVRDLEVPAAGREQSKAGVRAPLWIDESLFGRRERVVMGADGASLADRFVISVANSGEVPREVWIEERLRTAKRRVLKSGWPTKPSLTPEVARMKLLVKPSVVERAGFVIEYVF